MHTLCFMGLLYGTYIIDINNMLTRFSHVDCSPFSKFFLLKFTARYGDQSPWLNQVTEIIRAIELPKSKFYKVAKELRLSGCLEVRETRPTEIPQIQYEVKIEEPVSWLFIRDAPVGVHKDKIQQLLTWNSLPVAERPHQLTIPQRVLMIALLEEADAGGIIRNIGFSDLAQRTGMTVRQVKNQMAKLREFHYVRASLPGGNHPGLTGKFNSIHALNLRHPGFEQQRTAGRLVVFREAAHFVTHDEFNYFYFKRKELRKLNSSRNQTPHSQPDLSEGLRRLVGRTENLRPSSAWGFLNWLCHDLASRALTELWNELTEGAAAKLIRLINEKIRGEWRSAYHPIIEVDDGENPERKSAVQSIQPRLPLLPLVDVSMSQAVFGIALRAKRALEYWEAIPEYAEACHFQILPLPDRGEHMHFALEIAIAGENQLVRTDTFALRFNRKLGKGRFERITDVYDLGHSVLETTGLATPPLTCPLLSTITRM